MSASDTYVPIPRSERKPLPEARAVGPTDPRERLEVTLRLRRKQALPSPMEQAALPPSERHYLTSEQYDEQYGSDQQDMEKVIAFAHRHHLEVVDQSAARRTVVLSGTVEAASDAFQVTLENYEYPHGTYRGRTGTVCIPEELHGIVEGVFGLDNRPFARPHFIRPAAAQAVPGPSRRSSSPSSTTSRRTWTGRGRPSASSSWAAATGPATSRSTSRAWASGRPT